MRALNVIASLVVVVSTSIAGCGGRERGSAASSASAGSGQTVATAEPIRGGLTVGPSGHAAAVERPERVERDASVATAAGARGSVRLDSGAWVLLDQSTEVRLALAQVTLARGRAWVDTSGAEETTVETSHGTLTASGAAFSVAVSASGTEVYCGSGELTFAGRAAGAGAGGRLQQGESVTLAASGAPRPRPETLWDDWTGGLADPTARLAREPAGVGALSGRRMGDVGQARLPVPVRAHDVTIAVRGDLAITEVVQTFFNARSDVLEAEYAIRLPRGAIVSGFATSQGPGPFVEAAIGSVAMVGSGPAWSGDAAGPSALTYDGPDRLRARLYPLNPGATVRVRLRYAEWLERHGGTRTYVYPMAGEGADGPPLLGELTISADLSASGARSVRAGLGAQASQHRVSLRRSDFRPRADLVIDLVDDGGERDTVLASTVDVEGDDDYVLFDIPTPRAERDGAATAPLELVLLVDASGGMSAEHLELARSAVEAVLRQLGPRDRVALLVGDVTGHPAEGSDAVALHEATEPAREAILDALARVVPGGASDLARSLADAAVLVAGRPRGAVLYVGDGVPTTGALDATSIRASLSNIEAPPRFFGLAVGEGANVGLLRALFSGRAEAIAERTEASRAVMQILAEASQPTIRGVRAELGPTVERIYPSTLITLPAGDSLRLLGRLHGALPETVVLRGERDGEPFERRLAVRGERIEDDGFIRRRWATERLAELIDGGAPRETLVDLGVRFGVVTPWTALIVGAGSGAIWAPLRGFDRDPAQVAWALGGGADNAALAALGSAGEPPGAQAIESTWSEHAAAGGRGDGDGGVAQAAVTRALIEGERTPRQCYERRLLARPELSGEITVRVQVGGDGAVRAVEVTESTLRDPSVERCLAAEVRGVRFPATGGAEVTATHRYVFAVPTRELGGPPRCSPAARLPLGLRRELWLERLAATPGVDGALAVYREAGARCELGSWNARRVLLSLMLRHVGGLADRVRLYAAFGPGSADGAFLKQHILRAVTTPQELATVLGGLGLQVSVDWGVFQAAWDASPAPAARLTLVRRWLEAVPFDVDLRLRLVRLLEATGAAAEARRAARSLADDPLCDAAARAALAEFWVRQDEVVEARRVLSEIVERAPLDPWAHRRLGDLYLAFGWGEGAYREYSTLSRFRPADPEVVLLLARAAAASGRADEALRLEQQLSESVEPGSDQGVAAFARLWTAVRLARLEAAATTPELRAAVARRERASGALRDRPVLFAALTWDHPDRRPELYVRYPGALTPASLSGARGAEGGVRAVALAPFERVPLQGGQFGIEALRVSDADPGTYAFEVRRPAGSEPVDARLLVVVMPGTTDEHVAEVDVRLTGETRVARFSLSDAGELQPAPLEI